MQEPKTLTYNSSSGPLAVDIRVCLNEMFGIKNLSVLFALTDTENHRFSFCFSDGSPYPWLEPNEVYIAKNIPEDLIDFFEENHLGKRIPEPILEEHGYIRFAFDMDILREYDPKGVKEYLKTRQEQTDIRIISSDRLIRKGPYEFHVHFSRGLNDTQLSCLQHDLTFCGNGFGYPQHADTDAVVTHVLEKFQEETGIEFEFRTYEETDDWIETMYF